MDKTSQDDRIFIRLPSETRSIEIGPGTVPISGTSISTVSIAELKKSAREVSRLGIYDTDRQEKSARQ